MLSAPLQRERITQHEFDDKVEMRQKTPLEPHLKTTPVVPCHERSASIATGSTRNRCRKSTDSKLVLETTEAEVEVAKQPPIIFRRHGASAQLPSTAHVSLTWHTNSSGNAPVDG